MADSAFQTERSDLESLQKELSQASAACNYRTATDPELKDLINQLAAFDTLTDSWLSNGSVVRRILEGKAHFQLGIIFKTAESLQAAIARDRAGISKAPLGLRPQSQSVAARINPILTNLEAALSTLNAAIQVVQAYLTGSEITPAAAPPSSPEATAAGPAAAANSATPEAIETHSPEPFSSPDTSKEPETACSPEAAPDPKMPVETKVQIPTHTSDDGGSSDAHDSESQPAESDPSPATQDDEEDDLVKGSSVLPLHI